MNTQNTTFDIGQRIHELRSCRKLSQEQLALRSNITTTYLGLIERNLKNPTLKVVLDISLADFFAQTKEDISQPDAFSLQILSQISSCTEEEKKMLLRIIRDLMRFKENT